MWTLRIEGTARDWGSGGGGRRGGGLKRTPGSPQGVGRPTAYLLPLHSVPSPVYTSGTWATRDHQRGQGDQGPCSYVCWREKEALGLSWKAGAPQTPGGLQTGPGWGNHTLSPDCGWGPPVPHFPTIEMCGERCVWVVPRPEALPMPCGHPPPPPLAFLIGDGQEVSMAVHVHQGSGRGEGTRSADIPAHPSPHLPGVQTRPTWVRAHSGAACRGRPGLTCSCTVGNRPGGECGCQRRPAGG